MQICTVSCPEHTSKALRYGTRSQEISQFYLHHSPIHPLTEWTIPAFAFPAEAGTHLPTPEGWNAELALELSLAQ